MDQTRKQRYGVNSIAFRADAENRLSEDFTLGLGTSLGKVRSNADSETNAFTAPEPERIHFSYRETNYAVYGSLSGKLGDRVDFELGLRAENSAISGDSATENTPVIRRNTTALFPKVTFTYEADSLGTFTVNYARSIRRPDFSRTSPVSVSINPYLEGVGNVNLRPTFTHELSINHPIKNKTFFVTLYKSSDPMDFTISYDAENDRAIFAQVNLEEETGFNAGCSLPFTKGIWTSNNTATINFTKLSDPGNTFQKARPYLYVYTNHQLKIAKDTTLTLGAWAMTERREGIFHRNGLAVFEAALAKTLLKKWDCALRFTDITRAMNFKESYALNGVVANGTYFADAHEIALTVKYRFGGPTQNDVKSKDVDDNLDRIN